MPIAYCYSNKDVASLDASLAHRWGVLSGVPSDEMTISFVKLETQVGKNYDAMVRLFLPDIWNETEINKLQIGLAGALSEVLEIPLSSVHIITQVVSSGRVVENGAALNW